MASKEGRCINCGSIVFVDPKLEKGHCLFCDCVFDNDQAFEALEHPEKFEFPNVPQPKYQGESLQPAMPGRVVAPQVVQPAPVRREEKFEPQVTSIPKLTIPAKSKLIMFATFLILIGIVCAILIPTIRKRDSQHKAIKEKMIAGLADYQANEESVDVQNLHSDSCVLVLDRAISRDEAVELFDLYGKVRAEAMGIDTNDFAQTYRPLSLHISTPEGGYRIEEPETQEALETSDDVVRNLK